MTELIPRFEGRVLEPRPKPLVRVADLLAEQLPGFVDTGTELSGLRQNSNHFVAGRIESIPGADPFLVHARMNGYVPAIAEGNTLSIVAGVCMFGEYGIKSLDADGKPVHLPRIGISGRKNESTVHDVASDELQIYPQETIARLGRTTVALRAYAQMRGVESSIYWHIPTAEYKIHAELMHKLSLITDHALTQFYSVVDDHANTLRASIEQVFDGFNVPVPQMDSPLDGMLDHYAPGDFIGPIDSDNPEEVNKVLDLINVAFLRPYYEAGVNSDIPIFVDNISEQSIFESLKQLTTFRGLAIYPLPLAVRKDNKDLFYHRNASDQDKQIAVQPWLTK